MGLYIYVVDDVNLLSNAGELCDRQIFGWNEKVCQIMKLTVDISHLWCYISWAVGNNCFFDWDNSNRFLKEKKKFKKVLDNLKQTC